MARPALAVLDRYVLRELLSPFLLGVVLFTFFLVIDRLYELTELVITKGVPFHLVVQLLAFMLPSFLAHTLPMALLIAVLLAGGRLAGDLEVVAFKAAGVSLLRLFRPALLTGAGVMLATALLTLVLNPIANREFEFQLGKILRSRAVTGLKERVFNTSFGRLVVYVEEISASQVGLRGVVVSDERDPKLTRVITAREGRLLTDEASGRITLRLLDGGVHEADVVPVDAPASVVGEDVPTGGAAGARRYRYTAFGLYDMNLAIESPLSRAAGAQKPEKDFGLGELLQRIGSEGGGTRSRLPLEVELHKRFAFPVAALVFVLLGFPLAVRSPRGGRSVALVGTLVILVAYYLLLTSLEGVALRQRLPVAVAIWAPNAIFGALGAWLLWVTAREWRAPRLRLLWQVLHAVWERRPRRRPSREERVATAARDSTLIIDRYLLRQFAAFLGMGIAVAAVLIAVVELLQALDRYLRLKPPIVYILEHLVYSVLVALHQGLPVIMLVATIFLFLTLSRWHELTALKAAGVSLYRVSAPILVLGVVVAVGSGAFQEFVLPLVKERGEEVDRVKIRGQQPRHLQSRARLWLRSSETRFYRVELLSPATRELYGVSVLEIGPDFRLVSRLDARRARWTAGGWELHEGAVREIGPAGQVTTIPFGRTAFDLPETITDFTDIQKPPAAMSFRELNEYVGRLEAAGFQVRKYLVDLYSKMSEPLKNVVMVLVAISFSLQAPRGGRLYGIGLAIAIMAAYLVVDYSARSFARADLLPPLLAAWTANVIFLGVGASLFLRART